jgi:hypothetical protein
MEETQIQAKIDQDGMIIASSLCTKYGIAQEDTCYVEILIQNGMNFQLTQKNSLVISDAILILTKAVANQNRLVVHFGTSVGWPKAFVKFNNKKRSIFGNPYYFDLPAYGSRNKFSKIRKKSKKLMKYSLKTFLRLVGLYKPVVSEKELFLDIEEFLTQASAKFEKILWIQHKNLMSRSTRFEQVTYEKYFNAIIGQLLAKRTKGLLIAVPSQEFLNVENFCIDNTHLSQNGHNILAKVILEWWLSPGDRKCEEKGLMFY